MSIYQKILTKFGFAAQVGQFAEEYAEAYTELHKFVRGRKDADEHNALTELAHLQIVLRQMVEHIDPTLESYPEIYSDEVKRLQRLLE